MKPSTKYAATTIVPGVLLFGLFLTVWFLQTQPRSHLDTLGSESKVIARYQAKHRHAKGAPFRIAGQVLGHLDVTRVNVCAWNLDGKDMGTRRCVHPTEDGSFQMGGLSVGSYLVLCQADGYADATANDGDTKGALKMSVVQRDYEVTCTMPAGETSVWGHVRTMEGDPIEGATIEALGANSQEVVVRSAKSDATGRFQLPLGDEQPNIRARKSGYASKVVRVAARSKGVDLVLEPAATLSGIVVEAMSGASVPHVTVLAVRVDDAGGVGSLTTRSDAYGAFAFDDLEPGLYLPTVSDSGWFGAAERSVGALPGQPRPPLTVLVERGRVGSQSYLFKVLAAAEIGEVIEVELQDGRRVTLEATAWSWESR